MARTIAIIWAATCVAALIPFWAQCRRVLRCCDRVLEDCRRLQEILARFGKGARP